MMLLQMSKLCKRFWTSLTSEGPLTGMRPQMNFKVGELAEHLVAGVAPVLQLVVLLAERIWQRLVTSVVQETAGVNLVTAGGQEGGEGGRRGVQHL